MKTITTGLFCITLLCIPFVKENVAFSSVFVDPPNDPKAVLALLDPKANNPAVEAGGLFSDDPLPRVKIK